MFTLTLVVLSPNVESGIVQQKFLEFYGHEDTREFGLEDLPVMEDQIFELLSIADLSIDSVYFLLSDSKTHRTRKIEDYEDLKWFVEESESIHQVVSPRLPHEGNYTEVSTDLTYGVPVPLADPTDIEDSITPDDFKTITRRGIHRLNAVNPDSVYDAIGISLMTDPEFNDRMVIKDRLIRHGAAFPYLNEAALMKDFHRLSAMNEVTDADLVELLKLGFEGIKGIYGEAKKGVAYVADKIEKKREEAERLATEEAEEAKKEAEAAKKEAEEAKKEAEAAKTKAEEAKTEEAKAKSEEAEAKASEKAKKAEEAETKAQEAETLRDEVKAKNKKSSNNQETEDPAASARAVDTTRDSIQSSFNQLNGRPASDGLEDPEVAKAVKAAEDAEKAKEHVANDAESESPEGAEKDEAKSTADTVKDLIAKAKSSGDGNLKAAAAANRALKDKDPSTYEKLAKEIKDKADKLKDKD